MYIPRWLGLFLGAPRTAVVHVKQTQLNCCVRARFWPAKRPLGVNRHRRILPSMQPNCSCHTATRTGSTILVSPVKVCSLMQYIVLFHGLWRHSHDTRREAHHFWPGKHPHCNTNTNPIVRLRLRLRSPSLVFVLIVRCRNCRRGL